MPKVSAVKDSVTQNEAAAQYTLKSWLSVRLSAADMALLKKLAVEAGATVSDLVRGALMPHLVEKTA